MSNPTNVHAPLVSFVIATYGRPEALHTTLLALTLQTHTQWEAIVVGDCCQADTEETIRAISDPRIRYYNLPVRFGEQAGPNSFGMRLVQGEYMCFLNHDDLLLADHLSSTLATMNEQKADLYFGKYALAHDIEWVDGEPRPHFSSLLPAHSDRSRMYDQNTDLDPSSFWLIRTEFARAVGPWKLSSTIWRTPLSDWLLRAAATNGKVIFGARITGLRVHTHNAIDRKNLARPVYENATPELGFLVRLLTTQGPDSIRQWVCTHMQPASGFRVTLKRVRRGLRATIGLLLYKHFHMDVQSLKRRVKGEPRGQQLASLLKYRTGEQLVAPLAEKLWSSDPDIYRKI